MIARMRRLGWRWALPVAVVAAGVGYVLTHAPMLGLLGTEQITEFRSPRRHPPLCAVFLSGDMGFGHGMSGVIASALSHNGVPVIGINSPAAFGHEQTLPEIQRIVENAIRLALAQTDADKVLLMGQSYGADIMATTAPHLPPELRRRVAAIDLTVPALDVYFRADPSGFAYLGKPDARPLADFSKINWAPVSCLYGRDEDGSLCPALDPTRFHVVGLPGGHHLDHDHPRVVATTLAFLRSAAPGALE